MCQVKHDALPTACLSRAEVRFSVGHPSKESFSDRFACYGARATDPTAHRWFLPDSSWRMCAMKRAKSLSACASVGDARTVVGIGRARSRLTQGRRGPATASSQGGQWTGGDFGKSRRRRIQRSALRRESRPSVQQRLRALRATAGCAYRQAGRFAIIVWIVAMPSLGHGTTLVRECSHLRAKCLLHLVDRHRSVILRGRSADACGRVRYGGVALRSVVPGSARGSHF